MPRLYAQSVCGGWKSWWRCIGREREREMCEPRIERSRRSARGERELTWLSEKARVTWGEVLLRNAREEEGNFITRQLSSQQSRRPSLSLPEATSLSLPQALSSSRLPPPSISPRRTFFSPSPPSSYFFQEETLLRILEEFYCMQHAIYYSLDRLYLWMQ